MRNEVEWLLINMSIKYYIMVHGRVLSNVIIRNSLIPNR